MSLKNNQRGMTIMEIVIMVAVIGVVVAITYPKFRLMMYESREGRTKASLGDLRGAIAIYYSDNFGLFPADSGDPQTRLSQALVPQYLDKMPEVELRHHHFKSLSTIHDKWDDGGDWTYLMLNGFVSVNCTHEDTKGEIISGW